MTDPRRALPSVAALLEREDVRTLMTAHSRTAVTDAVRGVLDSARRDGDAPATADEWSARIRGQLERARRGTLLPVINATGVILHTNLGRAPLAAAAVDAMAAAASGYTNLEYDIDRGARGSRHHHCVSLLRELTGAEDAMVVTNCAGALVLSLNELAAGRDAVISRGELIEIGGSFRVPDIMTKSGATLVEVGTTNRTHLDDYRRALGERTGAIVKVHRSNFTVAGFVAEASTRDLAALARERGVPLVQDLGSGLMVSLESHGLGGEPTVREMVASGASLVLFSGDKLLGGPQAGIVVGSAALIDRLRRNPFARAMRVDKLAIAALQATLELYRDPARALRDVPVLAMLTLSPEAIRERARRLASALGAGAGATLVEVDGSVGGGAFPAAKLPSVALSLPGGSALEERLRLGDPPIIARIADDRVLLDLRTVPPARDQDVLGALRRAIA